MNKKSFIVLSCSLIIIAIIATLQFVGVSAHAADEEEGPPTAYGVPVPSDATLIFKIAGGTGYKIRNEIKRSEKAYRKIFPASKNTAITARTVGDTRIIIFESRVRRDWSSIQLTGIIGGRSSYIIISSDDPAVIDDHR